MMRSLFTLVYLSDFVFNSITSFPNLLFVFVFSAASMVDI